MEKIIQYTVAFGMPFAAFLGAQEIPGAIYWKAIAVGFGGIAGIITNQAIKASRNKK